MTTALERNDRYLIEFVERYTLCPFARRCRETGKLLRRVVLPEELEGELRSIEALPEGTVEVALLICPETREGPQEWEQRVAALRAQTTKFHCVAFHPELPRDLSDPHRAVPFIRRSPDPTVQLVNVAVLDEIRSGREGGSRFVDTRTLTVAQLVALTSAMGLSDAIAEQNLATLHAEDPDVLEELLASMQRH